MRNKRQEGVGVLIWGMTSDETSVDRSHGTFRQWVRRSKHINAYMPIRGLLNQLPRRWYGYRVSRG